MDIQSVIVSIDELNKTKTEIANAIRTKGVSSAGRFSLFPDEIKSIQGGSTGASYKRIMDNLSTYNIFKKNSNNELAAIGTVKETFNTVETNNITIYSLYNIENVKIADGPYKSRIAQTSDNRTYSLTLNGNDCGNVLYNTLRLSISPIEADKVDGTVVIKYTTHDTEYSVTMPIKDRDKPTANVGNVYWLMQDIFNPDIDNKDLRQLVSVKDANTLGATFYSRYNSFQTYQSRPAIFNKLDTVAGYNTVDAILTLNKNGNTVEAIPVKLARNIFGEIITLDGGGNGAVLEFDGSNLVFHYSNTNGQLSTKFIISKEGSTSKTDADIVQKIKTLNKEQNGYIGIAMYSDGSPITIAEAKAAGML